MSTPVDAITLRRWVYTLLIVVAMAGVLGRILSVSNLVEPNRPRADLALAPASILLPLAAGSAPEALTLAAAGPAPWANLSSDEVARLGPRFLPEPMPTLGANDRSRWATVRALVDHGTYVIGRRPLGPTVASAAGLLSAGTPLEAAVLAGAGYNVRTGHDTGIMTEDGWSTIDKVMRPDTQEFYSSKPPLLPTLLAGEYWLLKYLFGWSIADPKGRWLVVRTILVTVNWLPMLVYLALLARLVERFGTTDWGRLYVVAAAAFATYLTPFAITINNHTVAAWSALFALSAAVGALVTDQQQDEEVSPRHPVAPSPGHFLLAGFFAGLAACCELPAAAFLAALFLLLLARSPGRTLAWFAPAAALPVAGLLLTNYLAVGEVVPAYSKLQSPWYQYEGGYWWISSAKRGIDWVWQRESKATYAFHLLLGHHGLFSLTPIWLLAAVGVVQSLSRRGGDRRLRVLAGLTLLLSVVVIGFYLFVAPRMSNNYGGGTSGPRWFFWLTPFWLLAMLPAADRLAGCRWGRALGYVLLAVSVLSVSYPAWNPWRHPWIYNFFEYQGWIAY